MGKFTQTVKLVCVIAVCLYSTIANAQLGAVDTNYYRGHGVDFKCTGGLEQPDSSVIIIGRFGYVNQRNISGIAKLTKAGLVDYTFNPGKGANEHVNAVIRQPDGKLVIGGDFTRFNDSLVNHIARLNPDGSRDMSFVTGTGFTASGTIYSIYQQPDGKILLGGIFAAYNGTTANNIIRLNNNGTVDATFTIGTGFNSGVYSIDRQPDGKIIVGGAFTSYNGSAAGRIVRLNEDGTRDLSFAPPQGANNIVTAAYATTGGRIIVGGFFTVFDTSVANRIVRLNGDGSPDVTFNAGTGLNNNVNEVAIQADGKVLVTGGFTTYNGAACNRILRINTDGTRDVSYYVGTGLNLSANSVFIGLSNNIYVGGTFTTADSFSRQKLVRFLPTGKVDHSFMREGKLNQSVLAMAAQSDGKLITAGQFTMYNDVMANRITRLNLDGSIDQTFMSGIGANNVVRSIHVMPDDRILIGGDFTTYNGVTRNRIAMLKPNGSIDSSFTFGSGANGSVYKILLDTAGRIYIGGGFTTFNGAARARIARLKPTGLLDSTFVIGTGFNAGNVYDIVLQDDNKVVAVGNFTAFAGVPKSRLVRLMPAGSLDTLYNYGGAGVNNTINTVEIQPDGKILIGGLFTTYNTATAPRILRLKTDGTKDSSFVCSTDNTINDILLRGSRIFLSGAFNNINGSLLYNFGVIDTAGAIDTTNYYKAEVSGAVLTSFYSIFTKRMFLGGSFISVQGKLYNAHASLKLTNIDLLDVPGPLCHGAIANVRFNKVEAFASGNAFVVQLSDSTGKFSNPLTIGSGFNNAAGIDSIEILIPNNIPYSNNYFVRIVSTNPLDTSNLIGPIVIQTPVVPLISAGGPTAICPGQTVTLTSTVSASYLWNNGDTTQSIIADTTQNYTVTTSRYNCTATSAPFAVSTNNVPDSSIVATAASFCSGGSIMLTAAANNTYNWSTGDTTQSITVTQSGSYTLLIKSAANCTADSTVAINFANVGSYLVTPNGPTTFCNGGTVTLTSVPNATYAWSTGANTQSIVVTQPGTYRVTVTDNNSCSLASSNLVVVVNPAPNANVTPSGPTSFCDGNSVTLTAANGLNYAWNNGTTAQSVTSSASGFFNVTVTDPNTSCSAVSGTITVNENPNPIATYTQAQDTVCQSGGTIQLTGASPAGGVFSGSGVTGTTFNPAAQNGLVSITYTYTDVNNCSAQATDIVVVDICTGIGEAEESAINIYPNPAYNTLNIATGGEIVGEIIVTDFTGKVLIQAIPNQGENIITLNITDLSAGTYLISVGDSKSRFVKAN